MMTRELPQIFDGVKFIEPPDQSSLPPEAAKRLDAVRAASQAVDDASKQVAAAQADVTAALEVVAAAEAAAQQFYRYPINSPAGRSEQQHRLWQQATKGI